MANSGGSPTTTTKIMVDAYLMVSSSAEQCYMKTGDKVRLVRVEPDEFNFIHDVHGKLCRFRDEVLAQLIDQCLVVLPNTAFVEVSCKSVEFVIRYWVNIGISREAVELVSTRISRGRLGINFLLEMRFRPLSEFYDQVFSKWKSSKQFLMESASGLGLTPPADVIKMELYEHQKQGLRWMVDREELPDFDELPPFWEERKGVYRHGLSFLITFKRPQKLRGGIFADEPGMGKTLTLLSLIAYTKQHSLKKSAITSHVKKKQKVDNLPIDEEEEEEWRPTLVVCTPSVLATWKGQIEQCTCPGSLKVCTYSGKNKTRDPTLLRQHDLVLTTYNILKKEESDSANSSILSQIEWWRVVLDDVHVLLDKSGSRIATSFINLKAKRRWAVTGKPVHKDHNQYDIYPILDFLQVRHHRYRIDCPSHLEVWMGIFSLRRTMPVKSIENHLVVLSTDEQKLYKAMEVDAKTKFYNLLGIRSLRAAVLHLWQSCNSLALCRLSRAEMVSSKDIQDLSRQPKLLKKWVTVLQEENDYSCPICMDQPDDIVITQCTHMFCRSCIMLMFEKREGKRLNCPMCRGTLTKKDIYSSQRGPSVVEKMKSLMEEESSSGKMSSKVSALLNLLVKSRSEDPNRKSVVFSQFRRMLILVAEVLSKAGFDVRSMDVIDNCKKKAKTVEEFSNAKGPVVLLTTFKCLSNSQGLDLSAASNVYLLEPCWNVHTEDEALGRILPFGKEEDLTVVRLVSKNSIEERVLEMGEKKRGEYCSLNSRREINVACKSIWIIIKLFSLNPRRGANVARRDDVFGKMLLPCTRQHQACCYNL